MSGDDELSERIALFNQAHNELEAAELHAVVLAETEYEDADADAARKRANQLLTLATERLNAVFVEPVTLRSAIELLLCSINTSCLDRNDHDAIMDTKACARALRVSRN